MATVPPSPPPPPAGDKLTGLALFKKYLPQIGLGAGALVVIYGVSKVGIVVAGALLSLDIYTVFGYGFWAGLLTAGICGGSFSYLSRLSRINPEKAFAKAFSRIEQSRRVHEALGMNVRPGQLKAYVHTRGHVSLGRQLTWVEPRCQMLFQVRAPDGAVGGGGRRRAGAVRPMCVCVCVWATEPPTQGAKSHYDPFKSSCASETCTFNQRTLRASINPLHFSHP